MKIINGERATLGRLSSYVAKQALRGEEIVVVNCEKVVISGDKKNIQKKFLEKRLKVGSSQKGPRHSKNSDKVVKRAIRGMLPDHRMGRGKEALKRIKCYNGIPKEFEETKKISAGKEKGIKLMEVGELYNG
jgi:large subunit ribosomal protein L13